MLTKLFKLRYNLVKSDIVALNDDIVALNDDLKKYVHTPFGKRLIKIDSDWYLNEKKGYDTCMTQDGEKCDMYFKGADDWKGNLSVKSLKMQPHGGNLYHHSVWTMLHIVLWNDPKHEFNFLMNNVNYELAKLCAYLHDLGKGGDNNHNIYDKTKFNEYNCNVNDHTIKSGDFILNKEYLMMNDKKLDVKKLITSICKECDIKQIALTAYMHWEFGRLNMESKKYPTLWNKLNLYYELLKKWCKKCNLKPSLELLKLCIVVSCADIASGTNKRLKDMTIPDNVKQQYKITEVPDDLYFSFDTWVKMGMDKKCEYYYNTLIEFVYCKLNNKEQQLNQLKDELDKEEEKNKESKIQNDLKKTKSKILKLQEDLDKEHIKVRELESERIRK